MGKPFFLLPEARATGAAPEADVLGAAPEADVLAAPEVGAAVFPSPLPKAC